jgi:SAM-dependent methyltransferase
MNWHQTIEFIQNNPDYDALVKDTYISKDLVWNAKEFLNSAEFQATLKILRAEGCGKGSLLDIGAGNGISSYAFALSGFNVTAIEPDDSVTVGTGAILSLASRFKLNSLRVIKGFAENLKIEGKQFDVVYARQSLHHAADLSKFVQTAYDLLKPGGVFITVRDHVIFDQEDKEWFLEMHPLHKFYGGENAFTEKEYLHEFKKSGFRVLKMLKHYDSVINYAPLTESERNTIPKGLEHKLSEYIAGLAHITFVKLLVRKIYDLRGVQLFDEAAVAGRLRTFVLKKPEA